MAGDTTRVGQARTADRQTRSQPVISPGPNPAYRTAQQTAFLPANYASDEPAAATANQPPPTGASSRSPTSWQKAQTRCTALRALCERCAPPSAVDPAEPRIGRHRSGTARSPTSVRRDFRRTRRRIRRWPCQWTVMRDLASARSGVLVGFRDARWRRAAGVVTRSRDGRR